MANAVQPTTRKIGKDVLRRVVGRTVSFALPPPVRFVIFTRGRTGSNFLGSLLKSHPNIRYHGEIFGEYCIQNTTIKSEVNRLGPAAYFDRLTSRMLFERVVGVKLLYYQLAPNYAHHWKVQHLPEILPILQERKDLKIIHLKRRNKLATFLSRKLAERSSNFYGSSYDDRGIHLDFEECLCEFMKIEEWEDKFGRDFARHDQVEMDYEDLASDTEGELKRVIDLLSLDELPLSSRMRKQNTRAPADFILNQAELREKFAGTPYSWFFEV